MSRLKRRIPKDARAGHGFSGKQIAAERVRLRRAIIDAVMHTAALVFMLIAALNGEVALTIFFATFVVIYGLRDDR